MGHQQGLTIMSPPAPVGAGGLMPAMSKYWRISDTVTACLASEHFLFLDIAHDRYLALPPAQNDCLLSWLESPGEAPPQSCRALLAELGVTTRPEQGPPRECFVTEPTPVDPADVPRRRVRTGDLVSVGRATISAWSDVRSKPLAEVFARRFPAAASDLHPSTDLQSRLAVFRSARPLIPVRRVCLHDCLALFDWLCPHARGVSLVLGVSASPFAAHCWLQTDCVVIDDHPESPSRYQPILHFP